MHQYLLLDNYGILKCDTTGKPSSGTITIYDSGGNEVLSATDLSDLGASTTLSAAAGISQSNSRIVQVSSATGFLPNDTVKIKDAYGISENHVLAGADGYTMFVADTLVNDYPIGSTVQTTEVSYEVDDDLFSQVETSCRARFNLTIGSATEIRDIVFDVVHSPITQPLTVENLPEYDPTAAAQLPSSCKDWGKTLEHAWDRTIHYLSASGLYPKYAIDKEQLMLLHHLAFRWNLAEQGIEPHSDWIAGGAIGYFRSEFFATLETLKVRWLDTSNDLAPNANEIEKLKQTRIII